MKRNVEGPALREHSPAVPGFSRLLTAQARATSAFLASGKGQQIARGLMLLLVVVVTVLVATQPDRRTVTPTYHLAAQDWVAGRDLYHGGVWGYLYPPQFAILFTPFAAAPSPWGDILWRWVNLGLFLSALDRLARLAGGEGRPPLGALITVLSIPACLSSARNGQVNMTEAGLLVHAALDVAQTRWLRASLLLTVAVFLKPVALAMTLLAAATWGNLRPRLALAALALLLLPFAAGTAPYVIRQYQLLYWKWGLSVAPGQPFCDLGGLLTKLGIAQSDPVLTALRACAALAMLGLVVTRDRRTRRDSSAAGFEPRLRTALLVLALGVTYATVFNPRTETNGYVMLAPAVAAFAALVWQVPGEERAYWLLVVTALGLGADNYPLHPQTDLWLKPLLGLLFFAYLARWTLSSGQAPEA
jgi:alpha-1,2-mannosyltransferase